ncbi:MAG: type IX secretion system membrane protein PorP/SprF [Runella slithyformis]|nr:MAG: type IX secretion system membrane protein PorP/SprF [Runella slithyformis]
MKHTVRYFRFFCIAFLVSLQTYAQQDSQFSLFNFNQLYFNPASVGNDGLTRFQIVNRSQYTGYQTSSGDGGAPNTFMVSASVPLPFIKSAVGIHYVNDRIGASGSQEVQLSYAYQLKINDNTLALGARVGFFNRFIDFSRLVAREPGDPQIPTGRIGLTQPDLALGAYYDATDFYVGLGVNHLNRPQFRFTGTGDPNALTPNVYLNAGYRWEPIYGLEVQPMVLLKSPVAFSGKTFSVEGGAMATYEEKYFFGLTYRLQDAIGILGGVNLLSDGSLRVAAAFDIVTPGGKTIKSPLSYEILLSYALPAPRLGKKTIVRTPRFRY